jgi:hypothetical protein
MPLQPLADAIIFLNEKRGATPVIVTPRFLSLRRAFFLQLISSLGEKTSRRVRIDWYRSPSGFSGWFDHHLACWKTKRLNRDFERSTDYPNQVSLQMTATVSRPGGGYRELVVGLSEESQELPPWAAAIRLAGHPAKGIASLEQIGKPSGDTVASRFAA